MKKFLFYSFTALSIYFFISVLYILFNDYNRLTEYGFGYLTGKIILTLTFFATSIYLQKKWKVKVRD